MSESITTKQYALFKDEKQISKAHSTRIAVVAEAYSHGAVIRGCKDFGDEPDSVCDKTLSNVYQIKEVIS